MRNFLIKKIVDNKQETEINSESKYYRVSVNLIPKISKHYDILGTQFRCIEHMPGKVVLKNDKYTLFGKEKRLHKIFKKNGKV